MKKNIKKKKIIQIVGVFAVALIFSGCNQVIESVDKDTEQQEDTEDVVEHDGTHYHSAFTFVVDGEVIDYSGVEFMHVSPCTLEHEDEDDHEESTEPSDIIHLHNQIGNVVHVHADGVTWGELFISLNITELSELIPVLGVDKDGNTIEDIFNQTPKEYDSIVFQFGKQILSKEDLMKLHVSKEDILASEALVENCGK